MEKDGVGSRSAAAKRHATDLRRRNMGLAETREVEGDGNVLAVGGDDFDGSVVGGDIGGVIDEPDEPAGGIDVTVGGGIRIAGDVVGGGVGNEAKVFRNEGVVI